MKKRQFGSVPLAVPMLERVSFFRCESCLSKETPSSTTSSTNIATAMQPIIEPLSISIQVSDGAKLSTQELHEGHSLFLCCQ
jgi:hypothetical protein